MLEDEPVTLPQPRGHLYGWMVIPNVRKPEAPSIHIQTHHVTGGIQAAPRPVNSQFAMENGHFWLIYPFNMVIFHSFL